MGIESMPKIGAKSKPERKTATIRNPRFLEMFDSPDKVNALYERPRTLEERIKDADNIIRQLEAQPNLDQDKIKQLEYQRKRKADSEKELVSVREIIQEFELKYGKK